MADSSKRSSADVAHAPDASRGDATRSVGSWTRHRLASMWCLVVAVGDSVVTACRGRFPIGDEAEYAERPPHAERCSACQAVAIEHRRVELGLAELAHNSPATPAILQGAATVSDGLPCSGDGADCLFDVGGES